MCSGQGRELVKAGPARTGSARSPAPHRLEAGWFPLTPTNADLSLGEASAGRGGCPFSTAAVSPTPTREGTRGGPAWHHRVPRGRPLVGRQWGPLRANREPTVWSQLPGAVLARGHGPGADTHRLAFRTYNTERLPAPQRASWPWHLPPGISPGPKLGKLAEPSSLAAPIRKPRYSQGSREARTQREVRWQIGRAHV